MTRLADVVDAFEPIETECPRCQTTVRENFYGPCSSCRAQLREAQGTDARTDVEAEAYEPKMNVTPNAVALKE